MKTTGLIDLNYNLLLTFEIIPVSIILGNYLVNEGISEYTFFKLIISAALIQALLGVGAFFSPNLREQLIDLYSKRGYFSAMARYNEALGYRIYGFSLNLTFSMPIVQAFVSLLSLNLFIRGKGGILYLVFSILILLSGILNARVSVILFLLGLIMLFFATATGKHPIKRMTKLVTFLLLALFFGYVVLVNNGNSLAWLLEGINEVSQLFQGRTVGTFGNLFSQESLTLPEGINLFIGNGEFVMGRAYKYRISSDIGYVNDVWMGGVFYAFLLYIYYICLIRLLSRARTNNKDKGFLIGALFFVFFFVSNIKGYVFYYNELISLFYLVLSYETIANDRRVRIERYNV